MTGEAFGLSARSRRAHRVVAPFGGREGYVRLDRNEDPVGWPEDLVSEFARTLTPEMLSAYPDPTRLMMGIAQWLERGTDQILITSGSTEGLRLVFETFADESSTTVRFNPSYSLYELYESMAGSSSLSAEYSSDLVTPVDALLEVIESRHPSLVVIANPDQPTGAAITISDVEKIARVTEAVRGVLVVDEAYHLFGADSALPLIDRFPNLVIVRTFSKAFGLAGLRLGYLVAQPALVEKLKRLEPAVPPSSISLHGGVWVLDHMPTALERVADALQGRSLLAAKLAKVGAPAYPSLGNFLLIPVDSIDKALSIVAGSRMQGFLVKGPLDLAQLGICVRVTVGPQALMQRYWDSCGHLFGT